MSVSYDEFVSSKSSCHLASGELSGVHPVFVVTVASVSRVGCFPPACGEVEGACKRLIIMSQPSVISFLSLSTVCVVWFFVPINNKIVFAWWMYVFVLYLQIFTNKNVFTF